MLIWGAIFSCVCAGLLWTVHSGHGKKWVVNKLRLVPVIRSWVSEECGLHRTELTRTGETRDSSRSLFFVELLLLVKPLGCTLWLLLVTGSLSQSPLCYDPTPETTTSQRSINSKVEPVSQSSPRTIASAVTEPQSLALRVVYFSPSYAWQKV